MDFTFSETQQAVREAASGIFSGMVTTDRIREVEASEDRIDRELWDALANADLLSLALPESIGGAGMGMIELCLVLEAQGAVVAPVPLWSTLVLGYLPMARFGTAAVLERLSALVADRSVATAALSEAATSVRGLPSLKATQSDDGLMLTGTLFAVPHAHLAAVVVVPVRVGEDQVAICLLDPRGDGVTIERAATTNREIHPHLHLNGVHVTRDSILVGPDKGREALSLMLQWAMTGLCAISVGAGGAAIAQTAAHLNQREQFGRPLSTFQGTMLRAADAAIDLEAMRVTMWQAAWRIDAGLDAAEAVHVAKWQAADRGQRVVHATQHLHGGLGADITYPIHRYFLWGKQNELLLGSPSLELERLGALLAARPIGMGGR